VLFREWSAADFPKQSTFRKFRPSFPKQLSDRHFGKILHIEYQDSTEPDREDGNLPATALLHVEGLTKHFGGVSALVDYSIDIEPGELIGLIGPNGAGKTTVFNLLSGVLKPSSGRILFKEHDITHLRSDQSAALGIARTFQNIRLFNDLSVTEKIKVAFHMHLVAGFWKTLFSTPGFRRSEQVMAQKVEEFL